MQFPSLRAADHSVSSSLLDLSPTDLVPGSPLLLHATIDTAATPTGTVSQDGVEVAIVAADYSLSTIAEVFASFVVRWR